MSCWQSIALQGYPIKKDENYQKDKEEPSPEQPEQPEEHLNLINQLAKTTGSEYDKGYGQLDKSYREKKSLSLDPNKEAKKKLLELIRPSHCCNQEAKTRKQSINANCSRTKSNKQSSSSLKNPDQPEKPAQPQKPAEPEKPALSLKIRLNLRIQFNLKTGSAENLLNLRNQLSLKNQLNRKLRLGLKTYQPEINRPEKPAQPEQPTQPEKPAFNRAAQHETNSTEKPARNRRGNSRHVNRKNPIQPGNSSATWETQYFFKSWGRG